MFYLSKFRPRAPLCTPNLLQVSYLSPGFSMCSFAIWGKLLVFMCCMLVGCLKSKLIPFWGEGACIRGRPPKLSSYIKYTDTDDWLVDFKGNLIFRQAQSSPPSEWSSQSSKLTIKNDSFAVSDGKHTIYLSVPCFRQSHLHHYSLVKSNPIDG